MINQIHTLISNITPFDALEQEHINDTLSWIESGAPLFRIQKPDVPNKHLVSYFVVFDESTSKILLVDHKNAMKYGYHLADMLILMNLPKKLHAANAWKS